MKPVLLIAISMMLFTSTFAEDDSRKEPSTNKEKKIIRQADLLIRSNKPDYYKALELYNSVYQNNLESPKLNYKIGVCYTNTWEISKAIPFLEKALESPSKIGADARPRLAHAYSLNYEFDKAKEHYKKIVDDIKTFDAEDLNAIFYALTDNGKTWNADEDATAVNVRKKIEKRMVECQIASSMIAEPKNVKVTNLGDKINSKFPEYAPILKADESELYFTSRREQGENKIDKVDGLYFEDIFKAERENNEWRSVQRLTEPLNTSSHNAALALSADGLTMFLYDLNNQGDILKSELTSNGWSEPKALSSEINTSGTERSICISADKRKMFFERDNKNKTRDIYMTEMKKDYTWSKPVKLPAPVNTEYDEDGVFFHPDGKTLYFSSNGPKTMGGYDIFKTVLENGKWTEPENLGYPINTPGDDIFFILSADGKRGYYSSVRPDGLGFTDLYMVEMNASETEPTSNVTLLTGIINEDKTNKPVEAKIQIIDNESQEVVAELSSNPRTGNYLIALPSGKNYGIAIENDEHLFHSENFDIPDGANFKKVEKNITMKKAEVGSNIILRNIFFDFNKADIRGESYNELDRLANQLKKFSTIQVEISGHTDNVGEEDYNIRLSEERANAVKKYLVSKGINQDRMKVQGYGAKKPVAENVLQDGTDNPEGRKLNRRTEFEIISK